MNMKQISPLSLLIAFLVVCTGSMQSYGSVGSGLTGPDPVQAGASATANTDNIIVVIPNRPSVSELKLRGRIQGQYAWSDGKNQNTGFDPGTYSSFEMRRMRLGVQGNLYGDWSFMAEANVLSSVSLDAAMLNYTRLPEAILSFGKAKPRFGLEQNTSSASIITFERTRLDGHLNGGKPLGFRIHGNLDAFSYYLGVYNGQTVGTGRMSVDADTWLYNASIGWNVSRLIGTDNRIQLRTDYLYNDSENGYYNFEHAWAISSRIGVDPVDLRAEYMAGRQHDNQVVKGYYIMPSLYILNETLQAVVRYENVQGDNGVSLGHNRYADRLSGLYGAGHKYHAVYAGLNYYIYGDNLKLMLGAELAENNGSDNMSGRSFTLFSGFRMQF